MQGGLRDVEGARAVDGDSLGVAELVGEDGQHLLAQLTQEEAEALELERGLIVYVRPSRETVFSS